MIEVPDELQAERDALIAEIHAAFEGVTREGGVSWNETMVADDWGSDEACLAARESDVDRSWIELANDDTWDAGPGNGGWAFLDAIGFRYYLPAAMVRVLRSGNEATSCFTLDMSLVGGLPRKGREDWSLLDRRQCQCVAWFIRFMIAWEASTSESFSHVSWSTLYEDHWKQFE